MPDNSQRHLAYIVKIDCFSIFNNISYSLLVISTKIRLADNKQIFVNFAIINGERCLVELLTKLHLLSYISFAMLSQLKILQDQNKQRT